MSLNGNAVFGFVVREMAKRCLVTEHQTFSLGGLIVFRGWNYANDDKIINSCTVSRYRSLVVCRT